MTCDKCSKETDNLLELIRDDDENQMLCHNCWGYEDARGDFEYEKLKEENND
jgi:hypothetical protein